MQTKAEIRKRRKRTNKVTQVKHGLKKDGCVICGYKKCIEALEFHHVEANKERNLSRTRTFASLDREANKCIVVCANCHREIHSDLVEGLESVRTIRELTDKQGRLFLVTS